MSDKSGKKPGKLTNKQKVFVEHYLQSWNGAESAAQAGYGKTKSRASLRAIASENLTKPNIKTEIERRLSEKVMAADEVLARLSFMAEGFDPAEYMELVETYTKDLKGVVYVSGLQVKLDLERLREDGYSRLIKSVRNTANGPVFEFYDQQTSLKLVGEKHGLFDSEGGKPLPVNINVTIGKSEDGN